MKTIMQVLIIMLISMGSFLIVFSITMMFTHNVWLTVVPASAVSVCGLIYFDNLIYKLLNNGKK